jgi:hypothetical protein
LQTTVCVVIVKPEKSDVSLFSTVTAAQATVSQVNTFDQADSPGAVPEQVTVKVLPTSDVKPLAQLTTRVPNVTPVTAVVSLLSTVNIGQYTGSHDGVLNQSEVPGPVPEHVAVNETPEFEV